MEVFVVPIDQRKSDYSGVVLELAKRCNEAGFVFDEVGPRDPWVASKYRATAYVIWAKRKKRLVVVGGSLKPSLREVVGVVQLEVYVDKDEDEIIEATTQMNIWVKQGTNNDAYMDYSAFLPDLSDLLPSHSRWCYSVWYQRLATNVDCKSGWSKGEFEKSLVQMKSRNQAHINGCGERRDVRRLRQFQRREVAVKEAQERVESREQERRMRIEQVLSESKPHRALRRVEKAVGRVERIFTVVRQTLESWRAQDIQHAVGMNDGDFDDWS